jgi:hypothetical protein
MQLFFFSLSLMMGVVDKGYKGAGGAGKEQCWR